MTVLFEYGCDTILIFRELVLILLVVVRRMLFSFGSVVLEINLEGVDEVVGYLSDSSLLRGELVSDQTSSAN
jgi:hypothetical protein